MTAGTHRHRVRVFTPSRLHLLQFPSSAPVYIVAWTRENLDFFGKNTVRTTGFRRKYDSDEMFFAPNAAVLTRNICPTVRLSDDVFSGRERGPDEIFSDVSRVPVVSARHGTNSTVASRRVFVMIFVFE